LPTSLTYVVLSALGCSPWGPDAVIGTMPVQAKLPPPIFQGASAIHRTHQKPMRFPGQAPVSPLNATPRPPAPLTVKDNHRRDDRRRNRHRILYRLNITAPARRNFNRPPFRLRRPSEKKIFFPTPTLVTEITAKLRIG